MIFKEKADIYSAGIETHGLNENAVKSMARDAVDISSYTSNNVLEYNDINFDYIITVCDHANENCPYFPSEGSKRVHKNFVDPSKIKDSKNVEKDFDKCRDEIKAFSKEFKKMFF
tara:strand:+ start:91 stop:435 length:345 start_codon:yes stop_codon:yes gene_type:complete